MFTSKHDTVPGESVTARTESKFPGIPDFGSESQIKPIRHRPLAEPRHAHPLLAAGQLHWRHRLPSFASFRNPGNLCISRRINSFFVPDEALFETKEVPK